VSISDEELAAKLRDFTSDETTPDDAIRLFADARERCPVAHSEKQGGFRLLLNYDDVKSAQGDWQTFASSPSVTRKSPASGRGITLVSKENLERSSSGAG